jgi:hypothetical protein
VWNALFIYLFFIFYIFVLKLIVKFIGGEGEALQEEAVGSGHMGWKPLYLFQYFLFYFFSFFFYYSYVHTRLGSFLPPAPTRSLTTHFTPPTPPPIPSRNYFALISNFVVERV